jgi:hypothetical protein
MKIKSSQKRKKRNSNSGGKKKLNKIAKSEKWDLKKRKEIKRN